MLKIRPTIDWVKLQRLNGDAITMYVGLRADEELREGIYGGEVQSVFPLREWGWGEPEVWAYLHRRGVTIPRRTDCARCYGQRIGEWFRLWRDHPEIWASARRQEETIGHTFRRRGRDSWPTPLAELEAEFTRGRVPKDVTEGQGRLFPGGDDAPCRACSL